MRILIIGSVAAGTSFAAKARRNGEENEIVIYEKDTDVSYSSCGLPYYIGEDYIQREHLTPRNPAWFKKRFNIDIFTGHEVTDINYDEKTIVAKNLVTGEEITDTFDKLIFATGATPIRPNIEGLENENVFFVKNVKNADEIKKFISENQPNKAVIIGSGYIGLEMVENLTVKGIDVSVVEMKNSISPMLDEDVSIYIEKYLEKQGLDMYLSSKVEKIVDNGKKVILSTGEEIETDMVIVATGIRPNVELAKSIGVEIGDLGAIKVNKQMKTNLGDVYAVGDCAESYSLITGKPVWVPLGSTANKMGRIAGDVVSGGGLEFRGILGTGIFKIYDLAVARTGLTEKEAIENGYEVETIHNIKENQSKYLSESRQMVIKAVADKNTQKILGVQIVGENGVDKRIDVFATLITMGAKVTDLFHLDLAYAPPFSTTKDPVMYTGMIFDNAFNRNRKIMPVKELVQNRSNYTVIDVRGQKDFDKGHIEGALHIPLANLREETKDFDKAANYVVHCNKGVTGNAAQNLLINLGFENVYNLSGGYKNYSTTASIFE